MSSMSNPKLTEIHAVVVLRDALESMCFQYIPDKWDENWDKNEAPELYHSFMSAGEQACRTLAELFPDDWELTGSGAKWIGPVDEHGHPKSHSWAAR